MLRFPLAALAFAAACTNAQLLTEEYVRENINTLWSEFQEQHKPMYSSTQESELRFKIFKDNILSAAEQQRLNPLASFGVSRFSDLTDEEFSQRRAGMKPSRNHSGVADVFSSKEVESTLRASASVDWRTKGAVTPVKDQGDCGGCWSFATTGNIESMWAIAGNQLTPLSEQELLECDNYFPCMGCNGGEMSCAYVFLSGEKKGQIATEASYPYTAGAASKTGSCKGSKTTGATITGSKDLPSSETQMAAYVAANGPIAIGAYAIPWKQYKSGILTNCGSGSDNPDHAILIVGYGTDQGQDYWLIKNSWGESYGEEGYIRVARGKNLCKVASQPTTALVGKSGSTVIV
jgi:C1A family cysteine protease